MRLNKYVELFWHLCKFFGEFYSFHKQAFHGNPSLAERETGGRGGGGSCNLINIF
jgi:hypothetical protein